MPVLAPLLSWIGRSVVGLGMRSLTLGLPLADFLLDMANDAMSNWSRTTSETDRRAELEELARASPEEVRRRVAELVDELLPDGDASQRAALAGYLMQVPAQVRRTLRRPTEPHGRTVPAGFPLRKGADLAKLLPSKLPRFRPGDRPVGDYELVELLGMGGFGEVWKAVNFHLPSAPPVALKFCHDEKAARELRNAARVLDTIQRQGRHPGIVQLRNTYLSADPPCLEYEYVEGGDLVGLIQDWHRDGGPSPIEAARVLLRLAEIVAHAHGRRPPVVHRDLKPANILVIDDGGKRRFKITDFGIGSVAGSVAATGDSASWVSGSYSIHYASPQQQQGAAADVRDDVYALGVVWYQLLTGNLSGGAPSGIEWLRELRRKGMRDEQVQLLAACLEESPARRPANAGDLARRLRAAFKFEAETTETTETPAVPTPRNARSPVPATATPAPPQPTVEEPPRRRGVVAVVFGLLLLAGLAAGFLLGWGPGKPGTPPVVRPAPRTDLERIGNSVGLELVLLPAGTFRMGSPAGEQGRGVDEAGRDTTLTRPFWMSVAETTQGQYAEVMGENPSRWQGEQSGPTHPVERVPYPKAVEFCRRLTARPQEQAAGRVYALPTEAQWEYAARYGQRSYQVFDRGDVLSSLLANIDANQPFGSPPVDAPASPGRSRPVRSYPANAWGLFDLHGNVWEWCADWYGPYGAGPAIDPTGPAEGTKRVLRGGSYWSAGRFCRAACRDSEPEEREREDVGFRVACIVIAGR